MDWVWGGGRQEKGRWLGDRGGESKGKGRWMGCGEGGVTMRIDGLGVEEVRKVD